MGEQGQGSSQAGERSPTITRRRFVTYLLGFSVVATLGGVLTPIVGYLWPPRRVSTGGSGRVQVGKTADFAAGQGKVVPVSDKPVIVVNTAQGGLKAFSAICTHLGCIVQWDDSRKFIFCPCHDGRFNPVTGAVISGPPPAPLAQIELTVEGDAVYVSPGIS
jgi:cytochrome b6-f complex iron-sulfur subunit